MKSLLSTEELRELNYLLINQKSGISVFQAHGFLCAAASSPKLIPMKDWPSLLLGEDRNIQESGELLHLLQKLSREVVCSLDGLEFMPLVDYTPIPLFKWELFNEDRKYRLSLWCLGYLIGMELDANSWKSLSSPREGDIRYSFMILAGEELLNQHGIKLVSPGPLQVEYQDELYTASVITWQLPLLVGGIYSRWREKDFPRVSSSDIKK